MSAYKSKAIASLVTLAILAGGIYSLMREREPMYQGKSLTAWLRPRVNSWGEPGDDRPAKAAVRGMGTNAIPVLLRMLRETNSPFSLKMMLLSQKFNLPRSIFVPKMAGEENGLASTGFEWLGPAASNAAPALIEIYHQNISEGSQFSALHSLIAIGRPQQTHVLLNEALTNRSDLLRRTGLWYLTPTNQPDVAVPLLIKGLSDPSPRVQSMAVNKLRQFGTNALPAVPALVRLACSAPTNGGMTFGPSYIANRTLCLLNPQTAAKVLTNGYWTYEKYANDLGYSTRGMRPEQMTVQQRETRQGVH